MRPKGGQVAENLRQALSMMDAGVDIMRQNLKRKFPRASAKQIEQKLQAWMYQRPGAEFGDGDQRLARRKMERFSK